MTMSMKYAQTKIEVKTKDEEYTITKILEYLRVNLAQLVYYFTWLISYNKRIWVNGKLNIICRLYLQSGVLFVLV